MNMPIYLDHQASTPLDPRALRAMLPYLSERFGNPASIHHQLGRDSADAVEHARRQVAALVGAGHREIFFCSGATEANNLALKGLADGGTRRRLVTLATEHPAVLEPLRRLVAAGYELDIIGVDAEGYPDLDELAATVDERTLVVSVAAANNEIGTLPALDLIAEIAHSNGALLHTDAAQGAGKIDLHVDREKIDLMSISAHKLYGPQGVGALYVRREHHGRLTPLLDGGGHERGLRSGTPNTAGIVGLGAAAEVAAAERPVEARRLLDLTQRFMTRLLERVDGVEVNGPRGARLPGNLNLRIDGVDAEALIANCPELCFSAGSACAAAIPTPSHVLTAIGLSDVAAEESARFGFGRFTTRDQADEAAGILGSAIERIRARIAQPMGAQ
jgi:cysteine desulfurase